MNGRFRLTAAIAMTVLFWTGASTADAQYFGRNKVQYRSFSFEVLKTEHFDLYHYPEEAEAANIRRNYGTFGLERRLCKDR